jgi:predicted transposase YdaD
MANPHDKLFKAAFGNPKHAAQELQAVLPAQLKRAIDWQTIRSEPNWSVDARLSARFTDLAFSLCKACHRVEEKVMTRIALRLFSPSGTRLNR